MTNPTSRKNQFTQLNRLRATMNNPTQADHSEVHEYARHLFSSTVSWFNWFVGFNYAALGAAAVNLEVAASNRLGATLVALVFLINNVLGVVWLLHLRKYILAIPTRTSLGSLIPADSYAFASALMSMTCVATLFVWCASIALLYCTNTP